MIGGQFATATSTNPSPNWKCINQQSCKERVSRTFTSSFSEINWQGILKAILTARQVETRDCPDSVFSVLAKVSDTMFYSEEGSSRAEKLLVPQAHQGGIWKSLPRHRMNRKEAMKAKSRHIPANYSLTARQPLLESTGILVPGHSSFTWQQNMFQALKSRNAMTPIFARKWLPSREKKGVVTRYF